ncbi:MAG: HD domain-containing protein [Spirochaetales bacterium]|nr:HD domain-containing protein [Spirochaetales bacterium]
MKQQNKYISPQVICCADDLERTGRYANERQYYQHGTTTVYEHCIQVADVSCRIARRLHLKVNDKALIRGALLHDYFLYDWHDRQSCPRFHGFSHPYVAFKNANEDFCLNQIESNIIKCHMFPLTPIPPTTKEGWLVCIADKICALRECFAKRVVR